MLVEVYITPAILNSTCLYCSSNTSYTRMYLHYPWLVISTCFRFMYMYSIFIIRARPVASCIYSYNSTKREQQLQSMASLSLLSRWVLNCTYAPHATLDMYVRFARLSPTESLTVKLLQLAISIIFRVSNIVTMDRTTRLGRSCLDQHRTTPIETRIRKLAFK